MKVNLTARYLITDGDDVSDWSGEEVINRLRVRIAAIRNAREEIEVLEAKIATWEAQMRPFLEAIDATPDHAFTCTSGLAYIAPEGDATVWATDELEGLAKVDRYKYGYLTRYRRVVRVPKKVIVR